MFTSELIVKNILATRPGNSNGGGLITLYVECPEYLHSELNRHKRLSVNWVSHRTSAFTKTEINFYIPPKFFSRGKGMGSGPEMEEERWPEFLRTYWEDTCNRIEGTCRDLLTLGIAYEQVFRLLPATHMMKGIVTATEAAWDYVLNLRDAPSADISMQVLAKQIRAAITEGTWSNSNIHMPFWEDTLSDFQVEDQKKICAARCARISYGNIEARPGDLKLAESMILRKEWSPFEHIATIKSVGVCTPSAINCKSEDVYEGRAWQSFRAELELAR